MLTKPSPGDLDMHLCWVQARRVVSRALDQNLNEFKYHIAIYKVKVWSRFLRSFLAWEVFIHFLILKSLGLVLELGITHLSLPSCLPITLFEEVGRGRLHLQGEWEAIAGVEQATRTSVHLTWTESLLQNGKSYSKDNSEDCSYQIYLGSKICIVSD